MRLRWCTSIFIDITTISRSTHRPVSYSEVCYYFYIFIDVFSLILFTILDFYQQLVIVYIFSSFDFNSVVFCLINILLRAI